MVVKIYGFDYLVLFMLALCYYLYFVVLLETYLVELLHHLYQHQVHVVVYNRQTF